MTDTLYQQLIEAASEGNTSEVARLTAHHAEPLNCARAARWAAYNGHLECLKILMSSHNTWHDTSATLSMAAGQGHLDCVKYLINRVNPLHNNSVALVKAASNGHVECVRALIDVSDCANHGYLALLECSKEGHMECAQIIVEKLPMTCLNDLRTHFTDRHINLDIVDQLDAYAQRNRLMCEVGQGTTMLRRKI